MADSEICWVLKGFEDLGVVYSSLSASGGAVAAAEGPGASSKVMAVRHKFGDPVAASAVPSGVHTRQREERTDSNCRSLLS